MNEFVLVIKVIFTLVFILCLIYLSLRYGGGKLQSLQRNKYLKIIERIGLSKDNSLFVIKMGEKGYVVSSSQNKIQVLLDVPSEELKEIEKRNQFNSSETRLKILKIFRKKEE